MSLGITSGGCWRSLSMITTASPAACFKPAATAISFPKLRDKATALMRGSAAFLALTVSSVRSVEPSSIIRTSKSGVSNSSTGSRRSSRGPMPACSFKTGTTTDNSGLGSPRASFASKGFVSIVFTRVRPRFARAPGHSRGSRLPHPHLRYSLCLPDVQGINRGS